MILRAWLLMVAVAWSVIPGSGKANPLVFEADLQRVSTEIANPRFFNARTCADYVSRNTAFLYEYGAKSYLPVTSADRDALFQRAPAIVYSLFELRLNLRERLRSFHLAGQLELDCLDAIRRALRYARYVDELIAEWWWRRSATGTAPAQEAMNYSLAFDGAAPALLINPKYTDIDIRSGDIFLTRSPTFISATIARIGDEDGQFSHAAIAHVDSDGDITVLEAVVEGGVLIRPWNEWVAKTGARAVLLRHRDQQAAKAAADWVSLWAKERVDAGSVPYDFSMDYDDDSELFCLELVRLAYLESSGGSVAVPMYPSSLRLLLDSPFLKALGVSDRELFTPSDLEVDPSLEVVAEWRNLDLTPETRLRDAALSSIFHWMNEYDYRLTLKGGLQVAAGFVWEYLIPRGYFASSVPPNLPKGFLQVTLGMSSVIRFLEDAVSPKVKESHETSGFGIDFRALSDAFEAYRVADCHVHRERRSWESDRGFLDENRYEPRRSTLHRYLDVRDQDGGCPLPR
jgi:hypothetical protein